MLWSGADSTDAVWDSDEWSGRVREDAARISLASAPVTQSKSNSGSTSQPVVVQSITNPVGGDSFSSTADSSTTTNSNTFSITPIIQSGSVDSAVVPTISSTAFTVSSNTLSSVDASTISADASAFGNVGAGIAQPSIEPTTVSYGIEDALSQSQSIGGGALVPAIVTATIPIESSFVGIEPITLIIQSDVSVTDELTTVGDVSKLSVAASSGITSVNTSSATEGVSIRATVASISNDISDAADTTISASNSIDTIVGVSSNANRTSDISLSVDSSLPTRARASLFETFEIYSALEDAIITESTISTVDARNRLVVSPDGIVQLPSDVLLGNSQQINSAIDYTRVENETNIVTLEPSANEVIIDE